MSGNWDSLGVWKAVVPRAPLTDADRARLGLPATLHRIEDQDALQKPVFDPALKHHRNAYRASDPDFADPAARSAWLAARRTAMDLVLAAAAASPWRDHLVLRGSVLLAEWFGAASREPGDLDFVVVPAQWGIEEERTTVMLDDIARAAEQASDSSASGAGGHAVRFQARDAVSEDIWTYDRVPGRRLILPWTCDTTASGIVQLDIVFNELLPVPPQGVRVGGAQMLGASPELSLAWKLVWLVTDMHTQGKDLYDAVLLAEHCTVDYATLGAVFIASDPYYAAHPIGPDVTADMSPESEWRHFAAEYPHLASDPAPYIHRLQVALAPTFRTTSTDPRALRRQWSSRWLSACRTVYATGGLSSVLTDLAAKQTPAAVAAAVTRELLGPDACTPGQAVSLVLEHPAWTSAAELSRRTDNIGRLIEAVNTIDIGA